MTRPTANKKAWFAGSPGHKALVHFDPLVQEIFDETPCLETSQSDNIYIYIFVRERRKK